MYDLLGGWEVGSKKNKNKQQSLMSDCSLKQYLLFIQWPHLVKLNSIAYSYFAIYFVFKTAFELNKSLYVSGELMLEKIFIQVS